MLTYALPSDFPNTESSAATLVRLIDLASVSIRRATRRAVYATQPSGLPTDPDLVEAMRKACVAQVEILHSSGVGAALTSGELPAPTVKSGSVNGAALTYSTDDADAMRKHLTDGALCALAESYLEGVGLIPGELPGVIYG